MYVVTSVGKPGKWDEPVVPMPAQLTNGRDSVTFTHEMLVGMLRAAGGTLTWDSHDMLKESDEEVFMYAYDYPRRWTIKLETDDSRK